MVSDKAIKSSNALINDATAPSIAVFVGGTSGIGQYTIEALVATGVSTRIYLVGRKSSEERMKSFIKELHAVNPKAEIIWVEGEVSLLAESKRICEFIKTKESHIDLLFLTTGFAAFGGRQETAEGLEITQTLEYYTRMLFVQHLLPLLNSAEAARVISVLGGGIEKTSSIDIDDLGLKQPGNFGPVKGQTQFSTMNTICLDKFAQQNPSVTFIHSWPGWVTTGNVDRTSGPLGPLLAFAIRFILKPIIAFFSISKETSAQRYLFQSTSAYYGGNGTAWRGDFGTNTMGQQENGMFLVHFRGYTTPNLKVMKVLREKAMDKVWDHTQEVFKPYL
ncbi:unnamed protein product [Periconia digitata]|uniref:NAD(P)-binding protein n=1 Tax=Periconia digitata TaxID=1303443 RepID=A0A9W4TZ90_9PLEO|nr:unnamed protein product [Periconia digitata]